MRNITRVVLIAIAVFLIRSAAYPQSPRQRIAYCITHGAFNIPSMQACSGLVVLQADLESCMGGGPCFGEPALQPVIVPPGAPFCGSAGLPFCPGAIPCGFINTISCQVAPACGSGPFPMCAAPMACGAPGSFACPPPPPPPPPLPPVPAYFDAFRPTVNVILPQSANSPDNQVRFVAPNVPNLQTAAACREQSETQDEFFVCLAGVSPNSAYRLTRRCLNEHQDDAGAAFTCSTNNPQIQEGYKRLQEVRTCSNNLDTSSSDARVRLAACLGEQFLSDRDRYYANCILQSQSYADAAVCALTPFLTPEQQIGISCALTTGAHPYAYAACTGGRLAARELAKCWQGGIGTDNGCFGPNNELIKGGTFLNDAARNAFGQNSVVYQVVNTYTNSPLNPLSQGNLNNLNNVWNDFQNGPGPNNDAVKFVNQAGDFFNSVGSSVNHFANCIFGCTD
jgi:hypothetical protein